MLTKITTLVSPEELKSAMPTDKYIEDKISWWRKEFQDIIHDRSKKKVLIVWPCSMDWEDTLLEYAQRLKKISDKVEDKIMIIMRAYNAKPRTTVGWKWMIYDHEWIRLSRKIFWKINEIGLPIANELLYPDILPYYDDLLTYVVIWARNCENQQHREICSGLNIPVGMKNPTSWDPDISVNNIIAVHSPQQALIWWTIYKTEWNPDAHIVLRWSKFMWESKSNIDQESINKLEEVMRKKWVESKYIIDLNHDNSWGDWLMQPEILIDTLKLETDKLIWWMCESYMFDWNQKVSDENISKAVKWLSLTDKCLGIEKTEKMILDLYERI